MKEDTCADIVQRPLFDTFYEVDLVNPTDKEVYANLKENYPRIYEDLFEQQNSSQEIVFENPFKQRQVIVIQGGHEDIVHEFVFSCLTVNRNSKKMIEYFVSRAHLVNLISHENYQDKMKGVFISTYNDKNEIAVIALAEQPAYVVSPSDSRFNESLMSGFEIEVQGPITCGK